VSGMSYRCIISDILTKWSLHVLIPSTCTSVKHQARRWLIIPKLK
jgi:hypothetical protein